MTKDIPGTWHYTLSLDPEKGFFFVFFCFFLFFFVFFCFFLFFFCFFCSFLAFFLAFFFGFFFCFLFCFLSFLSSFYLISFSYFFFFEVTIKSEKQEIAINGKFQFKWILSAIYDHNENSYRKDDIHLNICSLSFSEVFF